MAVNNSTYGVTGIPRPSGAELLTANIPYAPGVPLRFEISKLFKSENAVFRKQWTLFVLALEAFKNLPVDDKFSYFQIAGIHGYPMTAWDDADAPPQDAIDKDKVSPGEFEFGGYCNHNALTFPTWHRPYLLLYEQCLWHHMREILASWDLEESEANEWSNAADTWRLPYWDWAREPRLPEAVTLENVTIFPPESLALHYSNPYPNPLTGFTNPEKDKDGQPLPFGSMPDVKSRWNIPDNKINKPRLPWSECSGTSRYGLDVANISGVYIGKAGRNNASAANKCMADFSQHCQSPYRDGTGNTSWKPPSSLSDAVHRMLCPEYNSTWGTFASTKWWKESKREESMAYMSLEYIHNNVHNISGGHKFTKDGGAGMGHMSDVPVAAFDPLFWLHHCNIDRLTAIWQSLNWECWWDTSEPEHPNHVEGNIPDLKPTGSLIPFKTGKCPNEYWTSDGVRDWTKLNYQYDDLIPQGRAIAPNGKLDEAQYIMDLENYIDQLYPHTGDYVNVIKQELGVESGDFFGASETQEAGWNDYILSVVYDRYALDGASYSIEFYLEDGFSEYFLGQIYSFGGLPIVSSIVEKSCANCRSQKDNKVLSSAQVPLTMQLISLALDDSCHTLNSIRLDDVSIYLREHIRWRFVRLGGQEVSADNFLDTSVSFWAGARVSSSINRDSNERHLPSTVYKPVDINLQGLEHTLDWPKTTLVHTTKIKDWYSGKIRAQL